MLTHADPLLITDAVVGIYDFDMTVPKEIKFSRHLFIGVETVPAGYAIARIDRDIYRHVAAYSIEFLSIRFRWHKLKKIYVSLGTWLSS